MQANGHNAEWTGPTVERVMSNGKRIYASVFKAWLVEQASQPGVSNAGLALRYGINANQLRRWVTLGHWHAKPAALLPVTVVAQAECAQARATTSARQCGSTMEIELCGALIRLSGEIDVAQLKTVLAVLRS